MKPLIYSYPSFVDNNLDASLASYPLWLASYSDGVPYDRAGWTEWTFLQYTDKGNVPGIQSPVDMNEFNGSVEDMFGYKMKPEDANKVIAFLSAGWFVAEGTGGEKEFKRLADELRKASGQPIE